MLGYHTRKYIRKYRRKKRNKFTIKCLCVEWDY